MRPSFHVPIPQSLVVIEAQAISVMWLAAMTRRCCFTADVLSVLCAVLRIGPAQFEILDPVVRAHAVDVVDDLGACERPPYVLGHHEAVFQYPALRCRHRMFRPDVDSHIPFAAYVTAASPMRGLLQPSLPILVGACAAAVVVSASRYLAGLSFDALSAGFTGNNHASILPAEAQ